MIPPLHRKTLIHLVNHDGIDFRHCVNSKLNLAVLLAFIKSSTFSYCRSFLYRFLTRNPHKFLIVLRLEEHANHSMYIQNKILKYSFFGDLSSVYWRLVRLKSNTSNILYARGYKCYQIVLQSLMISLCILAFT